MILAVDCGNSRLKWGLHENGDWRQTGTMPVSELARLEKTWKRFAPADQVIVANVAGWSVRKRLETLFARRSMVPTWVKAKRRECGVTNGYGRPDRLGADRWAALIGAWSILRGPCLVVTAGTATTVDILRGDGRFVGGAIIPGLELMKRSPARKRAFFGRTPQYCGCHRNRLPARASRGDRACFRDGGAGRSLRARGGSSSPNCRASRHSRATCG